MTFQSPPHTPPCILFVPVTNAAGRRKAAGCTLCDCRARARAAVLIEGGGIGVPQVEAKANIVLEEMELWKQKENLMTKDMSRLCMAKVCVALCAKKRKKEDLLWHQVTDWTSTHAIKARTSREVFSSHITRSGKSHPRLRRLWSSDGNKKQKKKIPINDVLPLIMSEWKTSAACASSLPRLHPGRAVLHQEGREVPGTRTAGLRSQCGSVRRHAVQPRPLQQRRDVRGLRFVCVVSAPLFLVLI